jgi:hypothetical protein
MYSNMNETLLKQSSLSINTKARFINTIRSLSKSKQRDYEMRFNFEPFEQRQIKINEECNNEDNLIKIKNDPTKQYSSLLTSSSSVSSLVSTASLKLDKFPIRLTQHVNMFFLNQILKLT